jgi:replicative DNA helicase
MSEKIPQKRTQKKASSVLAYEEAGKLQPQSLELEEAVLGALMLEKNALSHVEDILKPDSFYSEKHKKIYEAILDLSASSEPIDLLTVVEKLKARGDLEFVGGAFAVTSLTKRVSSAAHIIAHARIISEKAIKRSLIEISSEVTRDAFEDTTDVFSLLDKTQQSLFDVSEMHIRRNYADMKSILHAAITEISDKRNNKDGLTGVASGFTALDRVTSGWQKSDLIILAARPAMGKTAFVLTALRNAAVDFKKPVAIFSLEMSAVQLANRLLSVEAEIESDKIRNGKLSQEEWQDLIRKTAKLAEAKIFIDDTPGISILELRAKCRRLKSQHDIQMIVIDYLQLMSGDSNKAGNREQEIAGISRNLKILAKELDVPVIALSQLSRAVETRGGDKRPQLSDLRESGSIEQDADQVLFLYRPEYYGITQTAEGMPTQGLAEVIIAKNRHGSIEDVPLRFLGQFTKFKDWNETSGFVEVYDTPYAAQDFTAAAFPTTDVPKMKLSSKINQDNGFGIPDTNFDINNPPF